MTNAQPTKTKAIFFILLIVREFGFDLFVSNASCFSTLIPPDVELVSTVSSDSKDLREFNFGLNLMLLLIAGGSSSSGVSGC